MRTSTVSWGIVMTYSITTYYTVTKCPAIGLNLFNKVYFCSGKKKVEMFNSFVVLRLYGAEIDFLKYSLE